MAEPPFARHWVVLVSAVPDAQGCNQTPKSKLSKGENRNDQWTMNTPIFSYRMKTCNTATIVLGLVIIWHSRSLATQVNRMLKAWGLENLASRREDMWIFLTRTRHIHFHTKVKWSINGWSELQWHNLVALIHKEFLTCLLHSWYSRVGPTQSAPPFCGLHAQTRYDIRSMKGTSKLLAEKCSTQGGSQLYNG